MEYRGISWNIGGYRGISYITPCDYIHIYISLSPCPLYRMGHICVCIYIYMCACVPFSGISSFFILQSINITGEPLYPIPQGLLLLLGGTSIEDRRLGHGLSPSETRKKQLKDDGKQFFLKDDGKLKILR